MGMAGIVGDVLRAVVGGGDFVAGFLVEVFVEFLAAQHGVEPLDGADGDAADGVELVRGEVLDVVKLGELAAGVGRDELLELSHGLAAEIGAVHEEKDAPGAGELDEPIGEGAGGEGLARAGGHLDERARAGLGEGFFEIGDGLDLAVAHPGGGERMGEGNCARRCAQGVRLSQPFGEGLRAMEGEDAAGARVRIAFVAEKGLDAGRFVEERQLAGTERGKEIGQILGVEPGLLSDRRECACLASLPR